VWSVFAPVRCRDNALDSAPTYSASTDSRWLDAGPIGFKRLGEAKQWAESKAQTYLQHAGKIASSNCRLEPTNPGGNSGLKQNREAGLMVTPWLDELWPEERQVLFEPRYKRPSSASH